MRLSFAHETETESSPEISTLLFKLSTDLQSGDHVPPFSLSFPFCRSFCTVLLSPLSFSSTLPQRHSGDFHKHDLHIHAKLQSQLGHQHCSSILACSRFLNHSSFMAHPSNAYQFFSLEEDQVISPSQMGSTSSIGQANVEDLLEQTTISLPNPIGNSPWVHLAAMIARMAP